MIKFFKNFRKDESGAVTVDWVVLTAAVCALGGVAYTGISGGVNEITSDTTTALGGTGIDVTLGTTTAAGS